MTCISIITLWGWLGNVFIVLGLWGIGNKKRGAFLFSIAGESCWILKAFSLGMWDLGIICVVFLAMAVRAYCKWGKQ
jgi:hypothetical protein